MQNNPSRPIVDRLYRKLVGETGRRNCSKISKNACRVVPENFFRLLFSNSLTKIGDRLSSPKTTLAWLLQALGAPSIFAGLIVPIRESGSLLPQVFIGVLVQRLALRKWIWVAGSIGQGLSILGMAAIAAYLTGSVAGWGIILLLCLFSLCRGFCSVTSKDLLGKTIPKSRRGRLKGWMNSASGVFTIVAGVTLFVNSVASDSETIHQYVVFLAIAGLLWIFAAGVYSTVKEFPGETEEHANAFKESISNLGLVKKDAQLRSFIIVRALAIGSGMAAPYIITLAHKSLGGSSWWLAVFLIVDGIAAMISGPVWGKWADLSSRGVLLRSMGIAGFISALAAFSGFFELPYSVAVVFFPLVFFSLGIAHSGVRVGRKTYLVDMAEGNKRTDYVSCSNTLIGLILLIAGVITGLLSLLSVSTALLLFAAAAFTGVYIGKSMKDVSSD